MDGERRRGKERSEIVEIAGLEIVKRRTLRKLLSDFSAANPFELFKSHCQV